MRTEIVGGLTTHITGGTDGHGGGDGPVVLLMHGFGAPGTDLVPMWRSIDAPRGTRWVFPEALLSLTMGYGDARAWWLIDMDRLQRALVKNDMRSLTYDIPDGLAEARERVEALITALPSQLGISTEQLVIGGFSQGAMLATDVALRSERKLSGLVLLSGTLIAADEWGARMPWRKGLKVFQSHGQSDPILPFPIAEELRRLMTESALDVTWVPFRGPHTITPEVTTRLGAFLRGAFAPVAPAGAR